MFILLWILFLVFFSVWFFQALGLLYNEKDTDQFVNIPLPVVIEPCPSPSYMESLANPSKSIMFASELKIKNEVIPIRVNTTTGMFTHIQKGLI